ncbi:hypothetical protein GCM10011612_14150 [Actinomyces gaoshouyii]|uniref:Uncharacterized protein n=1 Tax=Actinomyces gaoshouyii TaxID=1960083 RepID=A0A8H9H936_9ACTO|nr:hypothetical protein GCM10011612_14150 [Actinomyces gaoshouyii]
MRHRISTGSLPALRVGRSWSIPATALSTARRHHRPPRHNPERQRPATMNGGQPLSSRVAPPASCPGRRRAHTPHDNDDRPRRRDRHIGTVTEEADMDNDIAEHAD